MNEQKLKQLKDKIVEAVPSILDLKFGCEILRYKNKPVKYKVIYKVITDMGYAANTEKVWINSIPFGSMRMPIELLKSELGDKTGDWIILGREPTLADVLLAIEKKVPQVLTVVTDENGTHIVDEFAEILRNWKWEQNTLSQQSKETITLLWKLLCGDMEK